MADPIDSALTVPRSTLAGRGSTGSLWSSITAHRRLLVTVVLAAAFAGGARELSGSLSSHTGVAMIDTAGSLIGGLAAFVFLERRRATGRTNDLMIAIALAMLSTTNLVLAAMPASVGDHRLPSYLQILFVLLAGIAAVALARDSRRSGDSLERALGASAAVLTVAYVSYLIEPSLSDERLYAGDILRLVAFLLTLYGCVLELHSLQRKLIQRTAVDERRRMARDMHDGLAQELAFIASHSQRLSHTGEDAATAAHLRSAAERALHDSRTTIAVLTAAENAPADLLIARTVDSFRARFGVEVELELHKDIVLTDESRNAMLRILHEALTNAVRHGHAERIVVSLARDRYGTTLRIADDGSGFEVQRAASLSAGLGLTSMRERAELLGGTLRIASTLGAGTTVEVGLP